MMGSSSQELQTALTDVSKTCHHLWEENKDLQGRFVNELGELQRLQIVIAQLEQQQRLENVFTVKQQMTELQKRAATLYEHLTQKRNDIVIKLNDGTNFATMLQVGSSNVKKYEKNIKKILLFQSFVKYELKFFTLLDCRRPFPLKNSNTRFTFLKNPSNFEEFCMFSKFMLKIFLFF